VNAEFYKLGCEMAHKMAGMNIWKWLRPRATALAGAKSGPEAMRAAEELARPMLGSARPPMANEARQMLGKARKYMGQFQPSTNPRETAQRVQGMLRDGRSPAVKNVLAPERAGMPVPMHRGQYAEHLWGPRPGANF
jgi:hypothetical protein